MGRWSDVDVLTASREWVSPWYPPTATRVSSGGCELYLDGTTATVMAVNGASPVVDDVGVILEAAGYVGARTVEFTLGPDDTGTPPPRDIGVAMATATVDIVASDLEGGMLDVIASPDLRVDQVRTFDQFAL